MRPGRRAALRLGLTAVLLAGLAPGLGGCMTTNPATGQEQFTPLMTPAQEVQVGAEEHPKIIKRFGGVYDDPQVGGWIAQIGGALVANSELPDLAFTFTVLDTDQVNAFAVPGGYVYITRGLIALANTEAEIAGVLAHEIGHVTARHTAQRYNRAVATNLLTTVLGAATGSREIAQVGQLVGAGVLASYSREQEYEADILGVRYMTRAGYNPYGQADLLSQLQRERELALAIAGREGADPTADFFASHPNTLERVQRAVAAADVSGAAANAPYRRDEFLAQVNGLIYGGSPDHGYIRGRAFWHPKLRFAFTVPPDFRLINTPRAVYAKGPGGAQIRFDISKKAAGADPLAYLIDVWARNLRLREVERITVNGLPAATGAADVNTRSGRRGLRLIAVRSSTGAMFRLMFLTPPGLEDRLREDLQRTTYSLRELSPGEAARLKPRRIRVVTVGVGDTVESIAQRMTVDDFPVERFRVLNALQPDAGLRAGERVKIVSE